MNKLLPTVTKLLPSVSFRIPGKTEPVPLPALLPELQKKRVVLFGERHGQPQVLKAQMAVLAGLAGQRTADSKLTMVLEMVNFGQQTLLDRFSTDTSYSQTDLQKDYRESGNEGFDMEGHYGFLLLLARELNVSLKAGFLPKPHARLAISDPTELNRVATETYPAFDLERYHFSRPGSDSHYAYFEAMIRGASRRPGPEEPVQGTMRRIFPAQLIKDASMAWSIDEVLKEGGRVLAICGNGHSDYGYGVPERITEDDKPFVITSRSVREVEEEGWDGESADALCVYDGAEEDEE